MSTLDKNIHKYKNLAETPIRFSIVVSIPACHAGDRGSIPRHGELFYTFFLVRIKRFGTPFDPLLALCIVMVQIPK